jgi:hypothetical protein
MVVTNPLIYQLRWVISWNKRNRLCSMLTLLLHFKRKLLLCVPSCAVLTTNYMNHNPSEGYRGSAGQEIANFIKTLLYLEQQWHKNLHIIISKRSKKYSSHLYCQNRHTVLIISQFNPVYNLTTLALRTLHSSL